METNKDYFKSTVTIDEGAQNLILELLKDYANYEDLPANLRQYISEYSFDRLMHTLNTNVPIKSRWNKLFVLVDYINAFVNGSLGSQAAKNIEDKIFDRLKSAMEDENTAVVVLIDSHLSDEAYMNSREGKHLPVLHANTAKERMVYGKLGELVAKYYSEDNESYKSSEDDGIWFIEKSQFGCDRITDGVIPIDKAIDKVLDLCDDDELEYAAKYMDKEYNWNHLYEVATNLANVSFVPDEIELAGVATNICVLSNAIILQTQYPQAEIYIHKDAVASYDSQAHADALNIMNGLGINIV